MAFRNTALYCEYNGQVDVCQNVINETPLTYDVGANKLTGGRQDYYILSPPDASLPPPSASIPDWS
eukprot:6013-Eustigmatos_ZCMA.PRE.1